MRHHVDRVWLGCCTAILVARHRDRPHHGVGDFVVALRPSIHNLVILLAHGDKPIHVLPFKFLHLAARFFDNTLLALRDHHVIFAKGNARAERLLKAQRHNLIAENDRLFLPAIAVDRVDHLLHFLFAQQAVDQLKGGFGIGRQNSPKAHAPRGRVKAAHDAVALHVYLRHAGGNARVQVNRAGIQCVLHFIGRAEHHTRALHALAHDRAVIQPQNHVLGRHDDRGSVGRR